MDERYTTLLKHATKKAPHFCDASHLLDRSTKDDTNVEALRTLSAFCVLTIRTLILVAPARLELASSD